MEFLLLWIDELDDALGALRHLLPNILGFFAAAGLFVSTGADSDFSHANWRGGMVLRLRF